MSFHSFFVPFTGYLRKWGERLHSFFSPRFANQEMSAEERGIHAASARERRDGFGDANAPAFRNLKRAEALLLPHNVTRAPAFGVRPSRAQKQSFAMTLRLSPNASANSLVPVAGDGHTPALRPAWRQLWGKSS